MSEGVEIKISDTEVSQKRSFPDELVSLYFLPEIWENEWLIADKVIFKKIFEKIWIIYFDEHQILSWLVVNYN